MAVVTAPHLASFVGPGMLVAPPPAQPSPSPGQSSGSGNSCAGEKERVRIREAELGHGASSDLDPREGGGLAERWVGLGQSGLRGSGTGRGKGQRTCRVCQLVSQSTSIYRVSAVNLAEG